MKIEVRDRCTLSVIFPTSLLCVHRSLPISSIELFLYLLLLFCSFVFFQGTATLSRKIVQKVLKSVRCTP